jgi:hypothetical protein
MLFLKYFVSYVMYNSGWEGIAMGDTANHIPFRLLRLGCDREGQHSVNIKVDGGVGLCRFPVYAH